MDGCGNIALNQRGEDSALEHGPIIGGTLPGAAVIVGGSDGILGQAGIARGEKIGVFRRRIALAKKR